MEFKVVGIVLILLLAGTYYYVTTSGTSGDALESLMIIYPGERCSVVLFAMEK